MTDLQTKKYPKIPNEIAKILLGDGAKADDPRSVETINAKIKNDPNYEALVQDAKDFEKEGLKLSQCVVKNLL